MPDPAIVLEGSAKALLYASLLLAIGASAARWLLLPRVAVELGVDNLSAVERPVARLTLVAAIVALAASGMRVWTHTVSAFGFDGAQSWNTLKLIAFQSHWGRDWKLQALAALVLVLACVVTVWRRAAWPVATVATLAFTATIPLLGHASGNAGRVALHLVHILAAGFWLGTLAVVLLIRFPPTSLGSIGPPLTGRRIRLLIFRRFFPIALSSSAIVIAAGLVAAWLYVGPLSNLWKTPYGHVLVLKVVLVCGVSMCGYLNWQRLRLLDEQSRFSMSIIVLEAILAVAVVIVTAYLTEISHP